MNMKKTMSLILALVMLLALAACGKQAAKPASGSDLPAATAAPEKQDALVVDTCILKEADDAMINNYTLLAVNPDAPFADADGKAVDGVEINTVGAAALINWLLSEEGEAMAAGYGFDDYGEYLLRSAFPPPPPSTIPACWAICCRPLRRSTAMRWRSIPPAPARPSPTPKWATPT